MSTFITNSGEKSLKERLNTLISNSEELKFLVGFFYFSGIRELYEGLKDKPDINFKVLVGLNVDKTNYGIIEIAEDEMFQTSDNEKIQRFLQSIKSSLNTDNFDNRDFYEQARFFIELIKNGSLTIRKTLLPNHAKLYIFKLSKEQIGRNRLFITGSSNLTKAGITTQNEFNVEISDYGFEEAEAYFEKLWSDAVKITEHEDVKDILIKLIENETLIRQIIPFEAYCLVLKHYIESFEQKPISASLIKLLEDNNYKPYAYQIDAIKQALSIIDKHNGVLIADVVGLGKTIIACAVAKALRKRGIIICPPGLMGDVRVKNSGWNMYKEQFGLYDWEVWSLGDLEKLSEFVKNSDDIEVVIVDEAHRFRNEDTKGYELLKNICRNKIVILLTATPFNNRPADILSLLKLFIVPKKSTIGLEDNLLAQFTAFKTIFEKLSYIRKNLNSSDPIKNQKAVAYYRSLFGEGDIDPKRVKQKAHYLAKRIRSVIEPVTIRRNRLDLINNPDYKDEIENLSKVKDPQEWFFELTTEQSNFYDKIITEYFKDPEDGGRFKGAIYRPFEYEKKRESEKLTREENREYIQQRNLFDIMRRLLVKRFESSFGAFRQSIENFKKITSHALTFIEKTGQYILDRSLLENIYDLDIDDIEKHLLDYEQRIKEGVYPKKHKRYKIEEFDLKDEFLSHIKSDLEMFNEILKKLDELNLVNNDPKLACLLEGINRILKEKPQKGEPKRKIVIFSEYVDTVKHLAERLNKTEISKRMLVVAGDLTDTKASQILENFDASYKDQKDEFDILLTSDKLSEGFNLNRAGMVINYDIPWNPVRVIQRIGRINRISKKVFEELYIVNFFPTERGAELVKSREIASNKMFLIHNTLGEDAKIFDIDEEPTASGLYHRIQQNPDELEEESFYTKALKDYYEIRKTYPEIINKLENFPPRVKTAKGSHDEGLLVFYKKGRLYVSGVKYEEDNIEPYSLTLEEAIDKIKCPPDEPALDWNSEKFWKAYEKARQFKENNTTATKGQSLENEAFNVIKTLISYNHEELTHYKNFLKALREDILDYGTLPDYTLRRIANINYRNINEACKELKTLMNELGEDYLERQKANLKGLTKEIIIAIENKRH